MQNYSNNRYQAPSKSAPASDMADRISNAIQSFRKEKEEQSRKKALAIQSLRLANEEKEGLEKTVGVLEDQCKALEAQVSGGAERELQALQKEVETLIEKANFQHHEMVCKRDKCENLQKSAQEVAQKRELAVRASNEKLRQLRDRLGQEEKNVTSPKTAQMELEIELNDVDSDRLATTWQRVLTQKADFIRAEAHQTRHSNEELVRILKGYQKQYNLQVGGDAALKAMRRLVAATANDNDDGAGGGEYGSNNDNNAVTAMQQ